MKLALAPDHGGFDMTPTPRARRSGAGHEVTDFGAPIREPEDDDPDSLTRLARALAAGVVERGIVSAAAMAGLPGPRTNTMREIRAVLDLKSDRAERHDMAAQHSDRVKQFETYLKSARVDSDLWPIRDAIPKTAAAQPKSRRDAQ